MKQSLWNHSWTVADGIGSMFAPPRNRREVTLPDDQMILQKRDPEARNGGNGGFYPGADLTYERVFQVAPDSGIWIVEFGGIYMNAQVYVNGNLAARCPYGYTGFYVDMTPWLKPGEDNRLKVLVRNNASPNSRWYTGTGIYRSVTLHRAGELHFTPGTLRVRTLRANTESAALGFSVEVKNESAFPFKGSILLSVEDETGNTAATLSVPATLAPKSVERISGTACLAAPRLWSTDTPSLYRCAASAVSDSGETLDAADTHFGIRTVSCDAVHGFQLNGKPVKLRGACIHHDNGLIGAAEYPDAAARRIALLKDAGFNALRSAHNPISKELLYCCDRLGMLVVDESFDTWSCCKTPYDYSLFFEEWWQFDTRAMVEKDYSHPSVVMYSIGNEVVERDGSSNGGGLARRQAEFVRSLDPDRPVTSALCGIMETAGEFGGIMANMVDGASETEAGKPDRFNLLTEEYASALDIVGYNYLHFRYEKDCALYPNRVFCGLESQPPEIDRVWEKVLALPSVIGDFAWVAWDYIGEAGVGKNLYPAEGEQETLFGEYPWRLAYCGDFDLCGNRRPQSYYREIVWGLRKEPYIATMRPDHVGRRVSRTPWSWNDVIRCWNWEGHEGEESLVEVYSYAPEVELYRDGVLVGTACAGKENRFRAVFRIPYGPGELRAVNIVDGVAMEEDRLKSAEGPLRLKIEADRRGANAGGHALIYCAISALDQNGVLHGECSGNIHIQVEGAAALLGFGSADPASEEDYFSESCGLYQGKALAVLRTGEAPGKAVVTVAGEGLDSAVCEIDIQ